MIRPLASTPRRALASLLILAAALSCSEENPVAPPELTSLVVTVTPATLETGQAVTATVTGRDQNDDPIEIDGTITWGTTAGTVASVNTDGRVAAVGAGSAAIIAVVDGRAGQATVTVNAPAAIKLNEVESSGGTPGDWAEFYNPTSAAVNISGWVVKDNDDTHIYTIPAGTTIAAGAYFIAEEAAMGYGLGTPDAVRLFNAFGVVVDSHSWTPHAATTYGRCPNVTGAFVTTTSSTKGAANDCTIAIKVNEVESNGGTPGDWIELYNAGPNTVDLSGYRVKDNDDTRTFALAAGTTIAGGGYLVVEEATFGFGLGQPDAARLFAPDGTTLIDSYTWDTHAAVTYGRCPTAGTGAFVNTLAATKGTANSCPGAPPIAVVWPGGDDFVTVDVAGFFGTNMSGLTYEGAGGGSPNVLWAVQNSPSMLFRLIAQGNNWVPDPANNWAAGKTLRYTTGIGAPDTEGVTFAGTGSAGGMYVATERNNDANTISRNSILRFDPNTAGATLTATNDWNITADLPVVGPNLGLEAITWVPNAFLTARSFFDESKGRAYLPADYPDHGTGIFFVGVEGNGIVYAYALNHVNNTFTRVATINSGFPGVMSLEFDRELNNFWVGCDNTFCGTQYAILEIDTAPGATLGRFRQTRLFNRPASLPNVNNEGFAFATQAECVGGRKPVFITDDDNTGGNAIRRGTITCVAFTGAQIR